MCSGDVAALEPLYKHNISGVILIYYRRIEGIIK